MTKEKMFCAATILQEKGNRVTRPQQRVASVIFIRILAEPLSWAVLEDAETVISAKSIRTPCPLSIALLG